MQENTATDSPPAPQTYLNVHNAMLGVHGKDAVIETAQIFRRIKPAARHPG